MQDTAAPKAGRQAAQSAGGLWTDLGPVLAFVLSYNLAQRLPDTDALLSKGNAIYISTAIFMAAIAGVIGWSLAKGKRIPLMLIITGVVVGVFGTLTLVFQSKEFAFHKPTIINALFAAVIFGGLAIGRNVWKLAFEHAFHLPDAVWKTFAIRWGLFYIFLAILNEVIVANFSEEFWVNSKIFLNIPLSIAFMAANLPLLMKHQQPAPGASADGPAPAAEEPAATSPQAGAENGTNTDAAPTSR